MSFVIFNWSLSSVCKQTWVYELWRHTPSQSHTGSRFAGDVENWRVPTTLCSTSSMPRTFAGSREFRVVSKFPAILISEKITNSVDTCTRSERPDIAPQADARTHQFHESPSSQHHSKSVQGVGHQQGAQSQGNPPIAIQQARFYHSLNHQFKGQESWTPHTVRKRSAILGASSHLDHGNPLRTVGTIGQMLRS